MRKMNKIISAIVLVCFLFNTAISDLAFSQDFNFRPNVDKLAVGAKTDDILGIEAQQMRAISMWFDGCIRYIIKKGFTVSLDNILDHNILPDSIIDGLKDTQIFRNEATQDSSTGIIRIEVRTRGGFSVRTYWAEYSKDGNKRVYPDGKAPAAQSLTKSGKSPEAPTAGVRADVKLGYLAAHPIVNALIGSIIDYSKSEEGLRDADRFVNHENFSGIYWLGGKFGHENKSFLDVFSKLARIYSKRGNTSIEKAEFALAKDLVKRAHLETEINVNAEYVKLLKSQLALQVEHFGRENGDMYFMAAYYIHKGVVRAHKYVEGKIHDEFVKKVFGGRDRWNDYRLWAKGIPIYVEPAETIYRRLPNGVDIKIPAQPWTYKEFVEFAHTRAEEAYPIVGLIPMDPKQLRYHLNIIQHHKGHYPKAEPPVAAVVGEGASRQPDFGKNDPRTEGIWGGLRDIPGIAGLKYEDQERVFRILVQLIWNGTTEEGARERLKELNLPLDEDAITACLNVTNRTQSTTEASSAGKGLTDDELRVATLCVQWDAVEMLAKAGSGHPKGSMNLAPLSTSVYFGGTFRYDANDPDWANRDRFVVSGGHTAPVYYASQGEAGFKDRKEKRPIKELLPTLREMHSPLQGHIDMTYVPADSSAGSLGKGVSASDGIAHAAKIDDRDYFVEVEVGDSESTEGQIAEALDYAGFHRLDNLIIWQSRNGRGLTGPLDRLTRKDDLKHAEACGFRTILIKNKDDSAVIENTRRKIRQEVREARTALTDLQTQFNAATIDQQKKVLSEKIEKAINDIKPTYVQYAATPGAGLPGMDAHGAIPKPEKIAEAVTEIKRRLKDITGQDFDETKRDAVMKGFKEKVAITADEKKEINSENEERVKARLSQLQAIAGQVKEVAPYDPSKKIATRMAGGDELISTMKRDPAVVPIDLELADSVMLKKAAEAFGWNDTIANPTGRVIQAACREVHSASLAAGLAACGKIPLLHTFASFVEMMIEPLKAILNTNLPVILVGTHGGLATGPDGRTHQDADSQIKVGALRRAKLIESCDAEEERYMGRVVHNWARELLDNKDAKDQDHIFYMRRARLDTPIIQKPEGWEKGAERGFYVIYENGAAQAKKDGKIDIVMVSVGTPTYDAIEAAKELSAKGVSVRVINVTQHKSLIANEENIKDFAGLIKNADDIITICDALPETIGQYVDRVIVKTGIRHKSMRSLGIQNWGESAKPDQLYAEHGFNKAGIVKAALATTSPQQSHLLKFKEIGQQIWLDGLTWEMVANGEFEELVRTHGITGVTTNPTLIKAYLNDKQVLAKVAALAGKGLTRDQIYFEVIKELAQAVITVFNKCGVNGKFSVELSPDKADDVAASVAEARMWTDIDPEHIMVKVAATEAGYKIIEEVTAIGRNVNATLIFTDEQYSEVAWAYVYGLERAANAGYDLSKIYSVASFFVSRWDVELAKNIPESIQGKIANAVTIAAYNKSFKSIFSSERFKALQAWDAKVQDFLVASTGSKGKDMVAKGIIPQSYEKYYPGLVYVEPIEGRNVVNTLPLGTIKIMIDKGVNVANTMDENYAWVPNVLAEAGKVANLDEVGKKLLEVGMKSFLADFATIMKTIDEAIVKAKATPAAASAKNTALRAQLGEIAAKMVPYDGGILAADESTGTAGKRLESVGLPNTPENRQTMRQLILTTPDQEKVGVSSVILYSETFDNVDKHGNSLVQEHLVKRGISPGIKTDAGLIDDPDSKGEKLSDPKGLQNLPALLAKYKAKGAVFTKWRVTLSIDTVIGLPTDANIRKNAVVLAKSAKQTQEAGLVPIIEPEVLLDGSHDIAASYKATTRTLEIVFEELSKAGVWLDGVILKTSMILSGNKATNRADSDTVGYQTLKGLLKTVPAEVAAVVFLSGGQEDDEVNMNLNAVVQASQARFESARDEAASELDRERKPEAAAKLRQLTKAPWQISYSFGRGLQRPGLKAWAGKGENFEKAQAALLEAARTTQKARLGLLKQTWPNPSEVTPDKRVVVLISGGESAGVNNYFAKLADKLAAQGYSLEVVRFGLDGLVKPNSEFTKSLAWVNQQIASNIINMPGAVEGTVRISLSDEKHPEYMRNAVANLKDYCKTIVIVGGSDHMFEATKLSNALKSQGINDMAVIALSKSIDYDAPNVYMIGADTAGTHANKLLVRAAPMPVTKKIVISEVMGRDSGYLTVRAADMNPSDITAYSKAELEKMKAIAPTVIALTPEWSVDEKGRSIVSLTDVVRAVKRRMDKYGAVTVAVSEGFRISAEDELLQKILKNPFFNDKFTNVKKDKQGNLMFNEIGIGNFVTEALSIALGKELGLERERNLLYELPGYSFRCVQPGKIDMAVADNVTQVAADMILSRRNDVIARGGVCVAVKRGIGSLADIEAEVRDLPQSRGTISLKDFVLFTQDELASKNVLGLSDENAPLPEIGPAVSPVVPEGKDLSMLTAALNSQSESARDMNRLNICAIAYSDADKLISQAASYVPVSAAERYVHERTSKAVIYITADQSGSLSLEGLVDRINKLYVSNPYGMKFANAVISTNFKFKEDDKMIVKLQGDSPSFAALVATAKKDANGFLSFGRHVADVIAMALSIDKKISGIRKNVLGESLNYLPQAAPALALAEQNTLGYLKANLGKLKDILPPNVSEDSVLAILTDWHRDGKKNVAEDWLRNLGLSSNTIDAIFRQLTMGTVPAGKHNEGVGSRDKALSEQPDDQARPLRAIVAQQKAQVEFALYIIGSSEGLQNSSGFTLVEYEIEKRKVPEHPVLSSRDELNELIRQSKLTVSMMVMPNRYSLTDKGREAIAKLNTPSVVKITPEDRENLVHMRKDWDKLITQQDVISKITKWLSWRISEKKLQKLGNRSFHEQRGPLFAYREFDFAKVEKIEKGMFRIPYSVGSFPDDKGKVTKRLYHVILLQTGPGLFRVKGYTDAQMKNIRPRLDYETMLTSGTDMMSTALPVAEAVEEMPVAASVTHALPTSAQPREYTAQVKELISHIEVSSTEDDMGSVAAKAILDDIEKAVDTKGRAVMLFASAPSQHSTWKWLIELWRDLPVERREFLAKHIIAFHMDEYLGLSENAPQLFGEILRKELFTKLGISADTIFYFDKEATNEDAQAHASLIANKFKEYGGVFDIIIGGIGKDSHLAFNSAPEAKFDDPEIIKLVEISEASRQQQVDDGQFEKLSDVPKYALTFTLSPMLSARYIHIMVPGAIKARAVQEILDFGISENTPASGLRLSEVLPHVRIYLDEESASKSEVAQLALQKAKEFSQKTRGEHTGPSLSTSLPPASSEIRGVSPAVTSAQMPGAEPSKDTSWEKPLRKRLRKIAETRRRVEQKIAQAEITAAIQVAGEAGLQIPTSPDVRYNLLVTEQFFKNGELDEHRARYGDRFYIDRISGATTEQFARNIMAKAAGKESRTVVLIPNDLPKEQLEQLTKAGIRFVMTNVSELLKARSDNDMYRAKFQLDTYVVMLLTRVIDDKTDQSSPIYRLLSFYLKTHFNFAEKIAIDDYIMAIAKNEIGKLIRGILAYRPAQAYDKPDYEKVAAALISA